MVIHRRSRSNRTMVVAVSGDGSLTDRDMSVESFGGKKQDLKVCKMIV